MDKKKRHIPSKRPILRPGYDHDVTPGERTKFKPGRQPARSKGHIPVK